MELELFLLRIGIFLRKKNGMNAHSLPTLFSLTITVIPGTFFSLNLLNKVILEDFDATL